MSTVKLSNMKNFIIIGVCFLLTSITVWGQRTVEGQFFCQAQASFVQGWTARVGVGQYGRIGYWDADAGILFSKDESKDKVIGLNGGYSWRIVSTPSRALSLYGGVGGLFGYLLPGEGNVVAEGGEESVSRNALKFGVYPRLELEVFPFAKFALFVSGSAPYVLTSPVGKYVDKKSTTGSFGAECSAGFRILF